MLQDASLKCCLRLAGPYNATQVLLKKLLVYPTANCTAKSRVIISLNGEKWINPAAFKGTGNCRKL